jgi:hypothetical protein
MILAEAAADDEQYAQAGELVNTLRGLRNASALNLPTNEEDAFKMIIDERRIEFLFEGHRWVDLKRLGDRGGRAMDRDSRECSFLADCTLSNSDFRYTLPIPVSELTANDVVQNPGY